MKQKITQFVEHLRSKDEETRKHIATGTMIVVGAVLILAWIATLDTTKPAEVTKKPLITEEEVRPFQMMKDNFRASFQTVSLGLGSLADDFKNRNKDTEVQTEQQTSTENTTQMQYATGVPEESTTETTTESQTDMTTNQ